MKCPNCGAENAANSRFCESCGKDIPAEEKVSKATGNNLQAILKNKSSLIGIGIIAVAVVALIIAIVCSVANSGNGFIEADTAYDWVVNEDGEYVFYNGSKAANKTIELDEEGYGIENMFNSLDGDVCSVLVDDVLYVIKNNKVTKVEEEVDGFVMSAEGTAIIYSIEESEDETTLVYYTVKNGKSVDIVTTDDTSWLNDVVISPDGKSVVYSISEEKESKDGEVEVTDTMYFFNGSKSSKIAATDATVMAVSNGGKYIYAVSVTEPEDDEEEAKQYLYVYKKSGDKEKIDTVSSYYMFFNADCTQVMYFKDNDKGDTYTYMSIKGDAGIKLAKTQLYLLTSGLDVNYAYTGSGYVYPVEDLYNHVYVGDGTAYLVKKGEDKTVKLVSDISSYTLDDSAEYLYYIESDDNDCTLMCLQVSKGENAKDKAVEIAEDVDDYVVTSDRKKVYFVSDETLYSVNGKKGGKTKTIASEDVAADLIISKKDVVYYECDDALYATTGSKGKKVLDDVEDYYTCGENVYMSDGDSYYIAKGKNKPSKLLDY